MALKKADEIVNEIDLVDYAITKGYLIDKAKSTNKWVKLNNNGDSIIVNTQTKKYYNPNNDKDKGDVIQFEANRMNSASISIDDTKEGFYAALKKMNENLGIFKEMSKSPLIIEKNKFLEKKETLHSLQNTEWNHKPIENVTFLKETRAIDPEILKHKIFENRLFNTYFRLPNSHIITNTGFGKFKNNELVGLEVRNTGLKNIMGDHDGLFITNTKDMEKINYVFYGESAIDIISYFEILNKNPNFKIEKNDFCFMSIGGNLYESKLNVFLKELDNIGVDKNTKFISITDNDFDKEEAKKEGKKYDVMITAALLQKYYNVGQINLDNPVYYELKFNPEDFKEKENLISEVINEQNNFVDINFSSEDKFGKYAMVKKDQESVSLLFPKCLSLKENGFEKTISKYSNNLYIPHKSKGKDWNDDLQNFKKKIENIKENYSKNIEQNNEKLDKNKNYGIKR